MCRYTVVWDSLVSVQWESALASSDFALTRTVVAQLLATVE